MHLHYDFELRINLADHVLNLIPYNPLNQTNHVKILNLHCHYDFELRINQIDNVLNLILYNSNSSKHKEMTFLNKTQATHNVSKEN